MSRNIPAVRVWVVWVSYENTMGPRVESGSSRVLVYAPNRMFARMNAVTVARAAGVPAHCAASARPLRAGESRAMDTPFQGFKHPLLAREF